MRTRAVDQPKKMFSDAKIQSACRFRGISDVDRGSTQATAAMKQNALMAALVYIWRSKADADERWVPFEVRTTTSPQDIIQVEGKEMGSRVKYSARTESKRV